MVKWDCFQKGMPWWEIIYIYIYIMQLKTVCLHDRIISCFSTSPGRLWNYKIILGWLILIITMRQIPKITKKHTVRQVPKITKNTQWDKFQRLLKNTQWDKFQRLPKNTHIGHKPHIICTNILAWKISRKCLNPNIIYMLSFANILHVIQRTFFYCPSFHAKCGEIS